ncbi:MAG: transglycosylase SLT domain-containing protein [Alphaproteobacteria bacterium]|jgi:hypothetical protein|nr:transglycosylase SLT domain-containing protein [Alphaproteobacteria bacterium]MDP6874513.1 transglycosylase SLT domain-containing protein [Alphaproteobacteria bacterium]
MPKMAKNQEKAQNDPGADEAGERLDCRYMVAAAERRYRIPAQLLAALALTESGHWLTEKGAFVAWPWTVYAQGKGRHLANQQAAVAEVRALAKKGVRNIDVGCMQVNLQYHPDAFEGLEEALNPATNIDYAARLLRRLYRQHRSWTQAVAHYHSSTKALNMPYRRKVLQLWYKERRRAINERRRLVQAAYNRRQAERRRKLAIK